MKKKIINLSCLKVIYIWDNPGFTARDKYNQNIKTNSTNFCQLTVLYYLASFWVKGMFVHHHRKINKWIFKAQMYQKSFNLLWSA